MGNAMALAALREVFVHNLGMRFTVTGGALRDHFVRLLVTGGAGQFGMSGRVVLQLPEDITMTGGTLRGGHVVGIGDLARHMRLVAGQTILLLHILAVRGVTMHAVGNHAVLAAMTGGTAHLGMFAFILLKLGHLVGVAGQAGLGDVFADADNQRRMRIVVAGEAVGQLKMGRAFMAVAAARDNVAVSGGMAVVTFDTGHLGSMSLAAAGNIAGGLIMALDTVIRGQGGAMGGDDTGQQGQQERAGHEATKTL